MQQDQAEGALVAEVRKERVQALELALAQPAGGPAGRRRHGGGQADHGDFAQPPEVGKILRTGRRRNAAAPLAAHVRRPQPAGVRPRHGHVGVVVAGNDAHPLRRAQRLQPAGGGGELAGKRDVDQVAGHRDVVGGDLGEIAGERVEHALAVDEDPAAAPRPVAEDALGGDDWQAEGQRRGNVRIREVRQGEHQVRSAFIRRSTRICSTKAKSSSLSTSTAASGCRRITALTSAPTRCEARRSAAASVSRPLR